MVENLVSILVTLLFFIVLTLPITIFIVPLFIRRHNDKPYFFNLIACAHIFIGVTLSISWLTPAPMSEIGGYQVLRDVAMGAILIGALLIFNGIGLLKDIRLFKILVPLSLTCMAGYSAFFVIGIIVFPVGLICAVVSFLYLRSDRFQESKSAEEGKLIRYALLFWIPVIIIAFMLFQHFTALHLEHIQYDWYKY